MTRSIFKVYGISDCKISKLLQDDDTALTYDSPVDVPGIRQIALKPIITETELRGDDQIVDSNAILEGFEFTIENAKISLEALEILEGGTFTDDATAGVGTYTNKNTDKMPYFKLEGQATKGNETGDVHVVLYKCRCTGGVEITFQNQEYAIVSASGKCVPTIYDGKIRDIVRNDNETPIA